MRMAWIVFGVALAGFFVFPVSKPAFAIAGLSVVALLPLLGYRDGTARALWWALIVPAAAFVADVLIFTPLTLQPDVDAAIFSVAALYWLPLWALLIAAGIAVRRVRGPQRAEFR